MQQSPTAMHRTWGLVVVVLAVGVGIGVMLRSPTSDPSPNPGAAQAAPASHAKPVGVRADQPQVASGSNAAGAGSAVHETPASAVANVLLQPHVSAQAEVEHLLATLLGTGASSEAWTTGADKIFHQWAALASSPAKVRMRPRGCFRAGCAVEVEVDAEAYTPVMDAIPSAPEVWSGGTILTEPIPTKHGTVIAQWILLRPPGS